MCLSPVHPRGSGLDRESRERATKRADSLFMEASDLLAVPRVEKSGKPQATEACFGVNERNSFKIKGICMRET